MEHLFESWPRVLERLKAAKRVMLLTDYDGTLTPIVERPEMAVLSPNVRALLANLSRQRNLRVGVISGRAIGDLKSRVGLGGLVYAGNHGLEIEGPGVSFVSPVAAEFQPILRVFHHVLNRTLKTIRGVLVEDKGLTLSIHYRQVDTKHFEDVEGIVMKVVGPAEANGTARVTKGKKVYEIRPATDWNKGKAISLLMKRYGKGGRMSGMVPVYLGDDVTDEDGFKVIEAYGRGISVYVGEPNSRSCASYFVRSPAEVALFLGTLAEVADEICLKAGGSNKYDDANDSTISAGLPIPGPGQAGEG